VDDTAADDMATDDTAADDTAADDDAANDPSEGGAGGMEGGAPMSDAGSNDAGVIPPIDWDAGDAGDAGPDGGTPEGMEDAGVEPEAAVDSGTDMEIDSGTTPEEAGTTPTGLSVACTYPMSGASPLQIQLTFTNNGTTSFDMSNATISYYFDDPSPLSDLDLAVYNGPFGTNAAPSNVSGTVVANPTPTTGAGYIGQISVGNSCPDWSPCSIDPGATPAPMTMALLDAGGGFDTNQHYSFAPLQADPCEFVVVEIGSEVVFGLPPATN
jgi:hypothetical protein